MVFVQLPLTRETAHKIVDRLPDERIASVVKLLSMVEEGYRVSFEAGLAVVDAALTHLGTTVTVLQDIGEVFKDDTGYGFVHYGTAILGEAYPTEVAAREHMESLHNTWTELHGMKEKQG